MYRILYHNFICNWQDGLLGTGICCQAIPGIYFVNRENSLQNFVLSSDLHKHAMACTHTREYIHVHTHKKQMLNKNNIIYIKIIQQ